MRASVAIGVMLSAVQPATAAEPTAFERFALDPNSVITASEDVGALSSVDSAVTATALVAVGRLEPQRVRGVRFELRNNGGTEHVYLDEPQLERLLLNLDMMEMAKRAGPAFKPGGAVQVTGTESCWMPNPVQRILCPEQVQSSSFSGLRLWTFDGAVYEFRGRDSTDLRALVERAGAALRGL